MRSDTLTTILLPPLLWEQQLSENSPFKQALYKFIKEEYGHRAVYELDVINPRWRESFLPVGYYQDNDDQCQSGRLASP